MTLTRTLCIALLFLLATLQGCLAQTESENIKTKGIAATMTVVTKGAWGGSADVKVTLRAGSGFGGTNIELSSGDTLSVRANGRSYRLSKHTDLFSVYYLAKVPEVYHNTEFVVSFNREEDTSAPSSTTALPEPFNITSEQNQTYNYKDKIPIHWEPSQPRSTMQLSYTLTCRQGSSSSLIVFTRGIPDSGSYNLNLHSHFADEDPFDSCRGEATLNRRLAGTLDPNFGAGGSIMGIQERTLKFKLDMSDG
ncbi:hypothetical protein ACFOSD_04865 [Salinispirillum marinum]|uniref:Lipoprotein n=2 Tax=Saccharospirillaceae TaxID=255527 RepID=A0ABV8BBZ9_9GAMM